MQNPLRWLSRRRFPYKPLITIELSKSALIHNLREFTRLAPNNSVAPVLKSNAYGHGLIEIASIIEGFRNHAGSTSGFASGWTALKSGSTTCVVPAIPFFIIDSYFEALAMRARGIRTPLLIIGYTRPETILHSRMRNIIFTVTSLDGLRAIQDTRHKILINLKVDTGMHRQGILASEIDEAMKIISANKNIALISLCSHLSEAANSNDTFTKKQISAWNEISDKFTGTFKELKYLHLSNTDGHRFTPEIKSTVSRLGLGLYGIANVGAFNPGVLNLKPVLRMGTIITSVKKVAAGQTIGYDNTFVAKKNMTVATIPVGYFEGLDRRLSNVGSVKVGASKLQCPIVGRISMNITTIDVSAIPDVKIGDEVVVISNDFHDANSIPAMTRVSGIAYELAVHIPPHLKRVVVS